MDYDWDESYDPDELTDIGVGEAYYESPRKLLMQFTHSYVGRIQDNRLVKVDYVFRAYGCTVATKGELFPMISVDEEPFRLPRPDEIVSFHAMPLS